MRSDKELQFIFNNLNIHEQTLVSFGIFPAHLMGLENEEAAELVRISQKQTGIEY